MDFRHFISATIIVTSLCGPSCKAQTAPLELGAKASSFREESKEDHVKGVVLAPSQKRESREHQFSSVHFSKKQFAAFSAGVYAASVADMHQTLQVRRYSWWYESDPLARPIVRLPGPAYYAAGLALATGLNWLSWKMGHSRRWHKFAPVPQLFSIAGNLYGFKSNCYSNY